MSKIILIITRESAGIDQCKINSIPDSITIMAIPCDTGKVINKGLSRLGHTIKKGRFAHIGTTHYGNYRFHDILNISTIFYNSTKIPIGPARSHLLF
jgi:hypothetical protein